MPIGSFLGIETALRGLVAQQRALDVTGHNIANVSTPGYSRQSVQLAPGRPLQIPAGNPSGSGMHLGTGVDVVGYQRTRDAFLDLQFRAQSMRLGAAAARTTALSQAELGLAEPGEDGLSAQLNAFWSSWSELANAPESSASRQSVVDRARTLASSINALDAHFAGLQVRAEDEFNALISPTGAVKAAAGELAGLNDAIASATSRGASPNDLLDRRDEVLDRLSSLAQVRVEAVPGRPGAVTVYFGDVSPTATPLVDGGQQAATAVRAWPLTMSASDGGQIGALADLADRTAGPLAAYRTELATFARTLADAVNGVYTQGGTLTPGFFRATAGDEAATITVEPTITVATLRTSTGAAGGNDVALQLAELRGRPAPANGSDDAYGALLAHIANDARTARQDERNADVLTTAVEQRRDSVSAVSLDEEMTNLIRFQRGYQASARVMSAMDEMLETLVNRTGRVGL